MATQQSKSKQVVADTKLVRDFNNPQALLLKIPQKNPVLQYRFIRNTPENISMMEAKGYEIASSDVVRQAGLKPRGDGSYKVGDLILAVKPMPLFLEHQRAKDEVRIRQQEAAERGTRGSRRVGNYEFTETVKQEIS